MHPQRKSSTWRTTQYPGETFGIGEAINLDLSVEATVGLLNSVVRSFGLVLPTELQGALLGAPLPLDQSILLIWSHLTGLIAITLLLFAIAYLLFQRQEIRA